MRPLRTPASLTDALGIQIWHDASGNGVPVSKIASDQGPPHCGWQDITFLTLATGSGERQFLRDTTGKLRDFLATTFDAGSTVPKGATDTGYDRDGRSPLAGVRRHRGVPGGQDEPRQGGAVASCQGACRMRLVCGPPDFLNSADP